MCSIGEDDFGDEGGAHAMVPDIKLSNEVATNDGFVCNKCKKSENGSSYKLRFREAECKECFLHYARHKFRAALGSSKVLPKDASVVMVFDGSSHSAVLLDMLHHAQTQNAFKRLHCNCTVLYIDDYQLIHGIKELDETYSENYRKFIKDMQSFLANYNKFESFIMPLADTNKAINSICNFKTLPSDYVTNERDHKHDFITSVNSVKSLTSRQDFVKHHRSKLLAAAAKYFKCEFVFMADISTDLASDLLAAVVLGRGGSAALDVALVDDRLAGDIQIVRPLKDLSVTEIELYIKAQDLQQLQFQRYGCDMGTLASLQNLTKSFVQDLQQNYSSTVSTVFRTGSKIAPNKKLPLHFDNLNLNGNDNDHFSALYCSFCNSQLDYRDSTTLLAIEFSRIVSEGGTSLEKPNDLNERAVKCVEGTNENSHLRKLCHACRNISADFSNKELF